MKRLELTKNAFTLAEIMIVLTVIGVLIAILLPVVFHSSPNENVMKFKKANNTLGTVIRELVSSDECYQDGDLGIKADGSRVLDETYMCHTMADIMNIKNVNCSSYKNYTYSHVAVDWDGSEYQGKKYEKMSILMFLVKIVQKMLAQK